jgi:hypothetical protein
MLLKTVNYRGGVVCLGIPSDWLEEYEDAGGGTFYKPGRETGTLRVNVTTGEGPPEKLLTVDNLAELLMSASESHGASPVHFGENAVIFRYDMLGEERGHSLATRCWGILQALPPRTSVTSCSRTLYSPINSPTLSASRRWTFWTVRLPPHSFRLGVAG